jgi:hypothetical protein
MRRNGLVVVMALLGCKRPPDAPSRGQTADVERAVGTNLEGVPDAP